jgi:tetratricopeptide (TPR) repeat protein
MDCRKSLVLALGLVGAVGCVPQQSVQPTPPAPPVVEKAKDLPMRPPKKPETCVALGDFFAAEGAAKPAGSAEQERLYDHARKEYQQALDIDANCVPAYRALGHLYVTLGDHDRAVAAYHKGLEKQPKQAALCFDLGMCHARYKEWDQAIEALRHASDLDPEKKAYQNTLGYCLARVGRFDEALATFSKSAGKGRAHYEVARMLYQLHRDAEAREHLEAAVREEPTFEPAHRLLARIDRGEQADPGVMPAGFEEPGADGIPGR